MKVAHLSDLHLGYGTPSIRSGRERDVLRVFESAMVRVAELDPGLVVISGDVFDHPNVPAEPIAAFTRAVGRFHDECPDVPIAIVAGARDTPLEPDRLGPLAVIGALSGVHVATDRVVDITLGDVHLSLVPHRAVIGARRLGARSDPDARWNVLVAYASIVRDGAHALPLALEGWAYVALGSEHTRREVAPSVHYAGSLERIGPHPWSEAASEKGFLTADLESSRVTFWPVEARAVVNLAPIEAAGGGPATVARRLNEALAGVPGGIAGKLLRVPIRGLTADDLASLDQEVFESVRKQAADVVIEALPDGGSPRHRSSVTSMRAGADKEGDLGRLLNLARRLVDGAKVPLEEGVGS